MQSAECRVRSAEWGVQNAECRVHSAECTVQNAEWGTQSGERAGGNRMVTAASTQTGIRTSAAVRCPGFSRSGIIRYGQLAFCIRPIGYRLELVPAVNFIANFTANSSEVE